MTSLAALLRDVKDSVDLVRAEGNDAFARSLDDVDVTAVTIDSRKALPGVIFVACPGATPTSKDGHAFLDAAVNAGAAALVVSDASKASKASAHNDRLPIFVAKDARRAAAVLAESVVGSPSRALTVVGVTGTNGKTTTTWLLAQIFAGAGRKSAVLGTLGAGPVDAIRPLGFTTPEAEVLSRELARLHADGVEVVAMEVSSHALATARVDGIRLAAAGFTNLTRDHLDFHGTMDAYFQAKARLFTDPFGRFGATAKVPATIPAAHDDDGWHDKLRALRPDAITWGPGGNLSAVDVEASSTGMRGAFLYDGKRAPFSSPLLGGYNVENLLVATGLALQCGLTLDEITAAIAVAKAPPGRLERVDSPAGAAGAAGALGAPLVVVDYAHSPDALERALHVMRPLTSGRLIVVFGAGGDRDAGKRSIMGRVAGEVADVVIVTDDNPRSEDGDVIAEQILAGVPKSMQRISPEAVAADASGARVVTKIRSRRMAIRAAIAGAHEEDTVVIAGKGHERTQTHSEKDGRVIVAPFDDVAESERALRGDTAPALLDATFVRAALKDRSVVVEGAPPAVLAGVSTDSRKIEPGSVFVALAGENFDGHAFAAHALGAGNAGAALIAQSKRADLADLAGLAGLPGTGALFVVDDTLLALQDLARAHVARLSATRIGLTGSNGKTTTKELLAACLRAHHGAPWVLATEGNLNNHIGVPLTALRCEPEHKALVFEMGMNHLKEIELLAGIVRPMVGLVTNMGTAHAGNFVDGVEGIAQAKAELYAALPKDGVAVVNADDARCVREAQRQAKCRHLSFGYANWADVRITNVADRETGGQELELLYAGKTIETSIPLEGRHNATNAAGAVAAALAAGVPFDVAARGLAATHAAHGRLERFVLAGGVWLLDDTYNANPDSMEAAFHALADLAGDRRKVVVLGEMRELGDLAESAHRHIGVAVAAVKPAALYACGPLGKLYGEGAVLSGFDAAHVTWADTNAALAPQVVAGLRDGDVVLVKGSRGARMEVVVNALRSARATPGQSGQPGQGAIA